MPVETFLSLNIQLFGGLHCLTFDSQRLRSRLRARSVPRSGNDFVGQAAYFSPIAHAASGIAMTSSCDDELVTLERDIAAKQLHVENQAVLIEVLERDGHDMVEQRKKLAEDRSDLARQMAQQRLLGDKVHIGERRELERNDVDEIAYISGDGSSLRCRVVNMSVQGAAIELPSKRHVDSTFKLMLEKDRIIRNCRLIWSSGNRIGVSFEDHL